MAVDKRAPSELLTYAHHSVPWGFRKLLVWIHKRYSNVSIIVTENGMPVKDEGKLSVEEAIKDVPRVEFFKVSGGWLALLTGLSLNFFPHRATSRTWSWR